MRALLDANVFISYLLARASPTPPVVVVEAAINRWYTLLVTARVIAEVRDKSENKPYLAARISQHQVENLVGILVEIAEFIPELSQPLPKVGRDRKDDYLFAHAVFGQADYLVSGDTGVQAVAQIGSVRIVSPAGFVQVLDLAPPTH